jgi:hypothetical protein
MGMKLYKVYKMGYFVSIIASGENVPGYFGLAEGEI